MLNHVESLGGSSDKALLIFASSLKSTDWPDMSSKDFHAVLKS